MAGMQNIVAGTAFVLARRITDGPRTSWTPDSTFVLHIPPTNIGLTPRHAHTVVPLMGANHSFLGAQQLADLTVEVQQGVRRALYSTRGGQPALLTGLQRAEALRGFFLDADTALALGTHRLEFHCDSRKYHFQVVQSSSNYRISNSDSSRVGGAASALEFVVVQDLAESRSLVGSILDTIDAVDQGIAVVMGQAALALTIAEQFTRVGLRATKLVKDVFEMGRLVLTELGQVLNGIKSIAQAPLDILESVNGLIDDIRETVLTGEDVFTQDYWRATGEAYSRLWARTKALFTTSPFGTPSNSFSAASGAASTQPASVATAKAALTAKDPDLGALINDGSAVVGGFSGLGQRLGGYTGWVPYVVQDGDTLAGIATEQLGSVQRWIDLAVVNDTIGDADLLEGQILKIPVVSGGIPFADGTYTELSSYQDALEAAIYFRDFKVQQNDQGLVDLVADPDTLTGVLTVTGKANFIQRYRDIIFRTELGSNPEFPASGIYLGIGGRRTADTIGLTAQTARAQLLADPRTTRILRADTFDTSDSTGVSFDVETAVPQPVIKVAA